MSDNKKPQSPNGIPQIPKHDESLWAAMLEMLNGKQKVKVEAKLEKIAEKKERKAKAPSHRWIEEEVILIIHEATCNSCSAHFQWPNPHLLLKKSHAKLGTHYVQAQTSTYADPEQIYSYLPFRREYQLTSVPVCMHCFDIAHRLSNEQKFFVTAKPQLPSLTSTITPGTKS